MTDKTILAASPVPCGGEIRATDAPGPELLKILQHSLGLDQYGQGHQYRNHFVAGGVDLELCRSLVALHFMCERPASALSGGSPVFHVTPAGIDAVALHSPAPPTPPKLTRSQKRYQEFRDVYDCYENFQHFLKCHGKGSQTT